MSKEEMKKLYGHIMKQYGPAMVAECKNQKKGKDGNNEFRRNV